MRKSFPEKIREMNIMYGLPVATAPQLLDLGRFAGFVRTLNEEFDEGEDILDLLREEKPGPGSDLAILTAMADWFGDMVVYIYSEAAKWGIPLDDVLSIIMDSNQSKLGADGKPIYNCDGKFLKGPNYWKPEPKIAQLLSNLLEEAKTSSAER
jgi:hypothetical protein